MITSNRSQIALDTGRNCVGREIFHEVTCARVPGN